MYKHTRLKGNMMQALKLLKAGKAKIVEIWKNLTVEPIMFSLFFGVAVQAVLVSALYYEKICKVGTYWFNNGTTFADEVCDHLDNGDNDEEQTFVQKTYAKVHFVLNYTQGIPPILFVLFLGPWSDHGGRKFIILVPLFGYVFYDLCFLANAIFFNELKVEFMMLEFIQDCFGSGQLVFLGCYSYLSDVTTKKTTSRLFRMSIMDAMSFGAWSMGTALGGRLYAYFGYIGVHVCGFVCHLIGIVYGFVYLKESRIVKNPSNEAKDEEGEAEDANNIKREGRFPGLFKLKYLKEGFSVLFRRRDRNLRFVLISLVALFGMNEIANSGRGSVQSQYFRKKFAWESMDYFAQWMSHFGSVTTLLSLVGLVFISPLLSFKLNLSDLTVTNVALMCSFLSTLIMLAARIPGLLYLTGVFGMLDDLTTLGIRSTASKIVGPDDVGKIFACIAAVQAISRLFSPIYNIIYLETLDWHPGLVFCLTETLLVGLLVLASVCVMIMRKQNREIHSDKTVSLNQDTSAQS